MTANEAPPVPRPVDPKQVGARIALARERAGLKQSDLASVIGVIPRSVQNYEYGRVPFRYLDRIAEAVGVSKDWILYGDAEPPEHGVNLDARMVEITERLDEIVAILRQNAGKADLVLETLKKRR